MEESIAALQQEADSIGGLFGFVKRNKIKKEIEACNPTCRLEMDGGINISNLIEILASGVDTIVAGTAVFGGSVDANINAFKEIMNSGE